MYERILVPLDGSELAERAIPYAERVARRLYSEVILFTAGTLGEGLERPLRAYLEKRAEELQSAGIKASPVVVQGSAADEILDFADKNNIGLIIISTHGRTGHSLWAMGSIAYKVTQRTRIPTLLIRSGELETGVNEKELRRILVPLDGSPFAEGILPNVKSLAKGGMDSEVILLRVIEPIEFPRITIHGWGEPDWAKYEKQLMAKTEKEANYYLDKEQRALKKGGVKVSSITLVGNPAQTILQYAGDNAVSLIALATHGFSGVAKWAFGSVASKIIEGSSKPVLIVRPIMPTSAK